MYYKHLKFTDNSKKNRNEKHFKISSYLITTKIGGEWDTTSTTKKPGAQNELTAMAYMILFNKNIIFGMSRLLENTVRVDF
jgi:hypothetical protein